MSAFTAVGSQESLAAGKKLGMRSGVCGSSDGGCTFVEWHFLC